MLRVLVVAALGFAGVAWAQAPDTGAAPPPAAPSAVADNDVGPGPDQRRYDPMRVVCKESRPETGTRIEKGKRSERICLTVAEWERREDLAREILKERDRGTCGSMGCGPS